MLLNLREYHRPSDAEDVQRVLALLARPAVRTVPLAGGDTLLGSGDLTVEAVVDLQDLEELAAISTDLNAGFLGVGAMTTRAALAETLARAYPWSMYQVIAEGARRWGGSVQRNRATVGGAIATAASNDPLLVALLACAAQVALETLSGRRFMPLSEFLAARATLLAEPAVIINTFVRVDPEATPPDAAWALTTVARTPSDAPIVVAAAMLAVDDGRCSAARVALGGVAEAPIVLPEVAAALRDHPPSPELFAAAGAHVVDLVHPSGDFRGSAEYRKAMAGVLAERALSQAWRATTSNE